MQNYGNWNAMKFIHSKMTLEIPKSIKTLITLFGICAFLLMGGCEINRLNRAEELHQRKLYAGAIEELDQLIKVGKNGAIITRAELVRSSSYLELGKLASARQNIPLAIRFFKLANSAPADVELAKIYMDLSQQAYREDNKALAMAYLEDILREIPNSTLIPEVLLRRISIFMDEYQDRNSTWEEYKLLHDKYPNNPYEIQARNYVLQFIDSKVDYAMILAEQGYHTDALKELFELARYPVVQGERINRLIAEVYQAQAEEFVDAQDYLEADRLFRIVLQYNPSKKAEIDARLEGITSLYIAKGNSLLTDRDFDAALLHYNKTFEIIPDYGPALAAIERVRQTRENIARAAQLASEAERLEATQKHADALALLNQAIALDPLPQYSNRAVIMQNLIEAERNPTAFAQRIINDFRGGILLRRVAAKRAEVLQSHKESEIRDSGWKILLSTGQYKYEARYDLLTPTDTFLYVWQINLRDRSVIPLNRLSEELMK
jgi:tetratricopeptide (TPR) repeat protein